MGLVQVQVQVQADSARELKVKSEKWAICRGREQDVAICCENLQGGGGAGVPATGGVEYTRHASATRLVAGGLAGRCYLQVELVLPPEADPIHHHILFALGPGHGGGAVVVVVGDGEGGAVLECEADSFGS